MKLNWKGNKAETAFGTYRLRLTGDGYAAEFEFEELAHVGFNSCENPLEDARRFAESDWISKIATLSTLPSEWQTIDTAPKDGTQIWVYYDHDADPYQDPEVPYKLTDYASNAEGTGFYKGKGQCNAVWQDGFHEADGPFTEQYWIPGGWFPWVNDEASDYVCNATHWQPLPAPPQ